MSFRATDYPILQSLDNGLVVPCTACRSIELCNVSRSRTASNTISVIRAPLSMSIDSWYSATHYQFVRSGVSGLTRLISI